MTLEKSLSLWAPDTICNLYLRLSLFVNVAGIRLRISEFPLIKETKIGWWIRHGVGSGGWLPKNNGHNPLLLQVSMFFAKWFYISFHREVESFHGIWDSCVTCFSSYSAAEVMVASSEARPQEASTGSLGFLPSCHVNKQWATHLRPPYISQSPDNLAANCRFQSEPSWEQKNHLAQSGPNCWPIESYVK